MSHVCSFHDNVQVVLLGRADERHAVHGILGQLGAILVETSNLLLDVVLEQVPEALSVAIGQSSELSLKQLGVENLSQSDSTSLHGESARIPINTSFISSYTRTIGVARPNSTTGGANFVI